MNNGKMLILCGLCGFLLILSLSMFCNNKAKLNVEYAHIFPDGEIMAMAVDNNIAYALLSTQTVYGSYKDEFTLFIIDGSVTRNVALNTPAPLVVNGIRVKDDDLIVYGKTNANEFDGQPNMGYDDAVIVHANTSGTIMNSTLIGSSGDDYINAVRINATPYMAVGFTNSTRFGDASSCLVSYLSEDYQSTTVFVMDIPVEEGRLTDVAEESGSDVYIAGAYRAPGFYTNAFCAKLEANGSTSWEYTVPTEESSAYSHVAFCTDGLVWAGTVRSSIVGYPEYDGIGDIGIGLVDVIDGDNLWQKFISGKDLYSSDEVAGIAISMDRIVIVATSDNVVGLQKVSPNGKEDIILAIFDADGNIASGFEFGGSAVDQATSVVADDSGGIWITGYTISNDFFNLDEAAEITRYKHFIVKICI